MSDKPPTDDTTNVLVFRNPVGEPIAVPDDVVTAAERAYRCWRARVGGKSWAVIAEEEHYPSPRAAKYDVDRYLEEARSLVVEKSAQDMLTLEVARLDELQRGVWPQAMNGHLPSATLVLNIIRIRADLLGLTGGAAVDPSSSGSRTVVVVGADSPGYIASLQRASEEND